VKIFSENTAHQEYLQVIASRLANLQYLMSSALKARENQTPETWVELENFKWGTIIKTTRLESNYFIFGGAECITIMKILKI
jgi:hypothetical protein